MLLDRTSCVCNLQMSVYWASLRSIVCTIDIGLLPSSLEYVQVV